VEARTRHEGTPTRKALKNESTTASRTAAGPREGSEERADSATAQFYINVKENTRLDKATPRDKIGLRVPSPGLEGMDVVDAIVAADGTRGETRTCR